MKPNAKSRWLSSWLIAVWLLCAAGGALFGQTADEKTAARNISAAASKPSPPQFEVLRYEEDWSILRGREESETKSKERAIDFEKLKYIPLGRRENWYLSIGGEIRQRYERTGNPLWGQEETDEKGYYQQRYLLHTDFHFGKQVRVFAQVGSAFETGRAGGPRPTDEDRLDVSQLFADVKFDLGEKSSLTVRVGRHENLGRKSRLGLQPGNYLSMGEVPIRQY